MSSAGNGENRAAILYAAGDVRVEDVERPEPGPHEVLRSFGYCGIGHPRGSMC